MGVSVLLIEDERDLAEFLISGLTEEGFSVRLFRHNDRAIPGAALDLGPATISASITSISLHLQITRILNAKRREVPPRIMRMRASANEVSWR